jgi:hypothetical protein
MSFLTVPVTVVANEVVTSFLDDTTDVTVATYKSGVALVAATGALYTCAYLPAGNYSYVNRGGLKVREDGAVCTTTGAGDLHLAGIAITEDGETVVAESATPVVFLGGIGLEADGTVAVTDEA